MNKITYYLFFLTLISYSQIDSNEILERIKKNTCEKPFFLSGEYYSNDISLVKNNNTLFFEIRKNNQTILETICDGQNLWNIDYEYEEISIYSLTENERENCFFADQVLKKIDDWKITENLILVKSNNDWVIIEELYNDNIEDCDIGTYNMEELKKDYNIIGNLNIIWLENMTLLSKYLPSGFNFKLNIDQFLIENTDFEVIDLR
tara:strand:+ start:346 stop:960 length:615 start_codon:yes stop_codon:yes gene_type:complete